MNQLIMKFLNVHMLCMQDTSFHTIRMCPGTFPISSVYTNLDDLFWRNNDIEDLKLDRDPYPWIIWYLWKSRNDNLFRGITREPEELIRHTQSECNAWFKAKQSASDDVMPRVNVDMPRHTRDTQALSLQSICLVDGSWTADSHYSGLGWVWMDETRNDQFLGLRNKERRLSLLYSQLETLIWAMENMSQHTSCSNFKTDCKDIISMIKDLRA